MATEEKETEAGKMAKATEVHREEVKFKTWRAASEFYILGGGG